MSKFNYFKRTKVDNSKEGLDDLIVELPKSKREVAIADLIANADRLAVAEDKGGDIYANGTHKVKFKNADGVDEELTVNELVEKHLNACKVKKNEKDDEVENESDEDMENEDEDVENESDDEVENEADSEEVENESDDKEKKAENKKKNAKKKNTKKNSKDEDFFKTLQNAHSNSQVQTIHLSTDQVSLGKSKYGSK